MRFSLFHSRGIRPKWRAVWLICLAILIIAFIGAKEYQLETARIDTQYDIQIRETGFLTQGFEYYVMEASASPDSVTETLLRLKDARAPTKKINATYCQLTERHWQIIGEMEYLKSLSLGFSSADNNALRYLARLKSLRSLNLSGTAVTDEGLEYLGTMPKLEQVYFPRASVTKTGIRNFCKNAPRLNADDVIRQHGADKLRD